MSREYSVDKQETLPLLAKPEVEGGVPGAHQKIGLWGLVVMGYFFIDGSMYGSEPLLQLGPPAHVCWMHCY